MWLSLSQIQENITYPLIIFFPFWIFGTRTHNIALAVLALNLQKSAHLCLLRAWIKGVCQHCLDPPTILLILIYSIWGYATS